MTAQHDDEGLSIEVLKGNPTDEELAAVVAVVAEAYRAELENASADEPAQESAWMRSRRNLREPLRRNMGYGGFIG